MKTPPRAVCPRSVPQPQARRARPRPWERRTLLLLGPLAAPALATAPVAARQQRAIVRVCRPCRCSGPP